MDRCPQSHIYQSRGSAVRFWNVFFRCWPEIHSMCSRQLSASWDPLCPLILLKSLTLASDAAQPKNTMQLLTQSPRATKTHWTKAKSQLNDAHCDQTCLIEFIHKPNIQLSIVLVHFVLVQPHPSDRMHSLECPCLPRSSAWCRLDWFSHNRYVFHIFRCVCGGFIHRRCLRTKAFGPWVASLASSVGSIEQYARACRRPTFLWTVWRDVFKVDDFVA